MNNTDPKLKRAGYKDVSVESHRASRKDTDLTLEAELLENINSTPVGRLLKIIGSLPEIRQDKVLDVRQRLDGGKYDLAENLNIAVDRIIEELLSES